MSLLSHRFHGAKTVFDTRSFMVDERIESGMWRSGSAVVRCARVIERRLLSNADAVTVVSRAGARALPATHRGSAPVRVRVIPPCVDLETFHPAANSAAVKAELGLAAGPAIVHSGALSTWYLAPYTFQVGAEFARRSGGSFVVLTRETGLANSLNATSGANAVVRSLDHSEMPRWLGACDAGLAVVRPDHAKRGSMPVKLGEYLACGLAVAATGCVGDVQQHLDGSPVALAFDPESEPPQGIAERLLAATTRPDRAIAARAIAERLYSLTRGVAAYAVLYEELLSCPA
jgi:glycosyltransferase involved in cell wall biosynthesis